MGRISKGVLAMGLAAAWTIVSAASCSLTSLDDLKGGKASMDAGTIPDSSTQSDSGSDASSCTPKTCAAQGAECGDIPDGCGGVLDCGACDASLFCGGDGPNKCGSTPCVPRTCKELAATCGAISDGCGTILDCGTCTAPETCGGGGTSNVCGCTPKPYCTSNECGSEPDGCGGSISCGICEPGYKCLGGFCECIKNPCLPV